MCMDVCVGCVHGCFCDVWCVVYVWVCVVCVMCGVCGVCVLINLYNNNNIKFLIIKF